MGHSTYERLDNSDADPFLSDLAERDTANSVTVLNTLLGDDSYVQVGDGELTSTKLSESLSRYSTDIKDRWSGAIFALNPRNPDAARHFCSSAREILADILDTESPAFQSWCEIYESYGQVLALETWASAIGTRGGFDPVSNLEDLLAEPVDRDALRAKQRAREHQLPETLPLPRL